MGFLALYWFCFFLAGMFFTALREYEVHPHNAENDFILSLFWPITVPFSVSCMVGRMVGRKFWRFRDHGDD